MKRHGAQALTFEAYFVSERTWDSYSTIQTEYKFKTKIFGAKTFTQNELI
jgi:hypothetical protein